MLTRINGILSEVGRKLGTDIRCIPVVEGGHALTFRDNEGWHKKPISTEDILAPSSEKVEKVIASDNDYCSVAA